MDLILTGRAVDAAEALQIGLANRVVATGTARHEAEKLAADLAQLPQQCLRADRLSALHQWGHPEADAMDHEFASMARVKHESLSGAQRFADGAGRHGQRA
jgi:enoyl-CoA hydratase